MTVTPILKVGKRTMTCSGHRVRGGGDAHQPDTRAQALTHSGSRGGGGQCGWGPGNTAPRKSPAPPWAVPHPLAQHGPLSCQAALNMGGVGTHARVPIMTLGVKDLESSHGALNKGLWSQPQRPHL